MANRLNVLQVEIYRVIVKLMQLRQNGTSLYYDGKYHKIFSLKSQEKNLLFIDRLESCQIETLSPEELKEICDEAGFRFPVFGSKCTVTINEQNFYIRSMHLSGRPLVNHSTRDKYLAVCEKLDISIVPFDKAVNEYWRKRILGVINEDVQNSSDYSPFADLKDYFNPILTYMAFTSFIKKNINGKYNADYILDFEKASDISTWHIYNKNSYIRDSHLIPSI